MPHKEHYRLNLPHFQQPGQAYFITWCLKDTVPAHALKRYTQKLEILKSQIGSDKFLTANENAGKKPYHPGMATSQSPFIESGWEAASPTGASASQPKLIKLKQQYHATRKQYIKAFNDLLDAQKKPKINLAKPTHTKIIFDALKFWENKKLTNHAFCIMPNHIHWVVELFEKDKQNKPVYLEDILKSVKQFSATEINKIENCKGNLWQKESFDTTIRGHKHLYNCIEYTLNNPVNAGFVEKWQDWPGCFQGAAGTATSLSPHN